MQTNIPLSLPERWRKALAQPPQWLLFGACGWVGDQGYTEMSGTDPQFGASLLTVAVFFALLGILTWLHAFDLMPRKLWPRIILAICAIVILLTSAIAFRSKADTVVLNRLIGPEHIKVIALLPDGLRVFPVTFEVSGDQAIRDANVICRFMGVVYVHQIDGKVTGARTDSTSDREKADFIDRLENTKFSCANPLIPPPMNPGESSRIVSATVGFSFEFSIPGDPRRFFVSNFYHLIDEPYNGNSRLRWKHVGAERGIKPNR